MSNLISLYVYCYSQWLAVFVINLFCITTQSLLYKSRVRERETRPAPQLSAARAVNGVILINCISRTLWSDIVSVARNSPQSINNLHFLVTENLLSRGLMDYHIAYSLAFSLLIAYIYEPLKKVKLQKLLKIWSSKWHLTNMFLVLNSPCVYRNFDLIDITSSCFHILLSSTYSAKYHFYYNTHLLLCHSHHGQYLCWVDTRYGMFM